MMLLPTSHSLIRRLPIALLLMTVLGAHSAAGATDTLRCTPVGTSMRQPAEPDRRKFDYIYYEALLLKNAGRYDAAFDLFRRCLEIDSTASAVLYELSSFYAQLDRPDRAFDYLKRAVEATPGNFTYRLALGALSLSTGRYGEAAEQYDELVKKYPEKQELNYYLAQALTQQGEIGKAIEAFDAIEQAIGMNEAVSLQKYKLYMTLEKPEKAFDELEKLADKFPDDPRYPLMIGNYYLEQKKNDQALEYFARAHAIDSVNPYYTVAMADYYETVGDHEAAQQQIREALVNDNLDVELKVSILSRYIQQLQQAANDLESGNALFEILLEQHPEEVDLKLMYGTLLLMQNKRDEARFQFELVAEMAPDNEEAWRQLINIALQSEQYDRAETLCRKCIELFPSKTDYYLYLGIACVQQEKLTEAIESYRAGAGLTTDNPALLSEFHGQMGDIYYQLKEHEKAFAAYDEALKHNERNLLVLNNYSYFLSLEKRDLDRAERMIAQVIKAEPNNPTYLDTYAWVFFVKGNYVLARIYIEKAIENDPNGSPELIDHYGDILFLSGERDKAVVQWKKARDMGKKTATLDRKIAEQTYVEAPAEE